MILQGQGVESLSSFIGVDGTNTTPNSGRIQINLKPRDERNDDASRHHPPPATQLAKVEGITLYMQPVQDLTVEDRVSRTQFQYSIEDADAQELAQWAPQDGGQAESAAAAARRGHRPAERRACRPTWSSTATRRRGWESLPQAIDNTLYDAFGQRQVSTIFTQLNQYHVVLEVDPNFQTRPRRAKVYCTSKSPAAGTPRLPLSRFDATCRA